MSSPSSSSSATAGRPRWKRLRWRRTLIAWGAAAITAAALYLTPVFVVLALTGRGWALVPLIACAAVLVWYSRVFGSPLGLLLMVVLIGLVEFLAQLGAAMAETCGDSGSATAVEQSGAGVLLLAIGGFGARRRRVLPIVGAIVAAAIWVSVVAHVVPGGTGGCFE